MRASPVQRGEPINGYPHSAKEDFSEIRVSIQLEANADPAEVEAFAHFVESHCPVGDTLTGGVPIICQSVTVR
jgi:uncharacterized OsmC-like protein